MNGIRLWPLRRDERSGALIGAGVTWRSDGPARVLAYNVNTRIDRQGQKLGSIKKCAIDSTRAGASGCLHLAATRSNRRRLRCV